jgi:hypothetical protein
MISGKARNRPVQKVAVAYFLIAIAAVLIVTFSGGAGLSLGGMTGYLPYIALFAFVVAWEALLYYAHFLNLYVNGFGVIAITILCNIFIGLSLNMTIMIIVPIAAIMMAMTASSAGSNGGGDEQE